MPRDVKPAPGLRRGAPASSPMSALGATLSLLAALALAGCGFQLRGSIDLPPEWEALHLDSASPNGELSVQLRNQAAQAGIQWLPRDEANYVVHLGQEQFESRNLSIGANARASEFELDMSTRVRVTDRAGAEVLPDTPFRVVQVIVNDPNQIAGVAEETRLLREEMRVTLVQQILRKLRFVAERNPAGSGTVENNPTDDSPADGRPAEGRPADGGATEGRPTDGRPTEPSPAG